MDDTTTELTERFERYCSTTPNANELPSEILTELKALLRLYSISPEELDFKWQAYNMKMGGEENKLDLKTARHFRNNLQDTLERESRSKAAAKNDTKRVAPTPRAGGKNAGDVFDMLEGLVPNTPRPAPGTVKRKANFQTPGTKASKAHEMSSPGGMLTPKGEANGAAYVSLFLPD
jgi:DNA polymerase alpha subunit B